MPFIAEYVIIGQSERSKGQTVLQSDRNEFFELPPATQWLKAVKDTVDTAAEYGELDCVTFWCTIEPGRIEEIPNPNLFDIAPDDVD